jgi:hypothetical protein
MRLACAGEEAGVTLAALLLLSALGVAAQTPALTFTKVFPGSQPAYESVTVTKAGAMTYKEFPADNQPVHAQIPDRDASALFDLAAKLDYFRSPLESGLKVANTGKKAFIYNDGAGKTSNAVFNYSQNPFAQQLLDKFEQIGESERALLSLERTAQFDKLGVNDSLAEIEALWLNKHLAAPLQFIPLLTKVASHESYMHLARDRAARLKDEFQAPPAAPKAPGDPSK